jgi:Fe-S-cluster-containing dehydrogenase component
MPRSSQKRRTLSIASCTSGLSKFRSGWCEKKRCQKYCPATGSHVQFEGSVSMKMTRASGHRTSTSDQTYQSRFGESGLERDSWNHG